MPFVRRPALLAPPHRVARLTIPLIAVACVREVGRGPDLGDCAIYPDGVYTYGEIGIGTCLAGPADLQFIEKDGETWLAVTNADPFGNFGEGSFLLIPWDQIDLTLAENDVATLDAAAVPLDPLAGGIGWVSKRDLVLVASRYSEGAFGREFADPLRVIDLSDPHAPEPWAEGDVLVLEDDPQPVVVDEDADVAYVLNITDHSVSVVDLTPTPLEVVDLHPTTSYSLSKLIDGDGSGSTATVVVTPIEGAPLPDDQWTLTFAEGSWRLWVSEDDGLRRWTTGGVDYVASGLGIEFDPDDSDGDVEEIVDPYFFLEDGFGAMLFADRGAIRTITTGEEFDGGTPIGAWAWDSQEAVLSGSDDGWDYWVEGPSPQEIDDLPALFYTGREDDGADGAIGLARALDGDTYTREAEPVLEPPAGASWEQPFVLPDPFTSGYRMWFSSFDGARWSIQHSASADGLTWSAPEPALSRDDADVAGPAVTWSNGRYQMWVVHRADGSPTWDIATTEGFDGLTWADPSVVIPGDPLVIVDHPPRPALQPDAQNTWRIEGVNTGLLPVSATPGAEYLTEQGFSFHVSGGWWIDVAAVPGDVADGGLVPDAWVTVDGVPTVYATAIDLDGRSRLVALQQDALGHWGAVADDLVPAGTGGNVDGARSALVLPPDTLGSGEWVLLYAAVDATGAALLRRATSVDGLTWAPEGGALLPVEEYDTFAQLPHSAESLDDGTVRVWYTADSGSSTRIAAIDTVDGGQSFTRFETLDGWQLGTGIPGEIDDSGVSEPWIYNEGGTSHLLFTAFDGDERRIVHAIDEGGTWVRDADPWTEAVESAMIGVEDTFSTLGVSSPTGLDGGADTFLYAGTDGFVTRIGRAHRVGPTLFPEQDPPTTGDQLVFSTTYGGAVAKVIELGQVIEGFETTGIGATAMRLDPERGFLYVTSKLADHVFVVDVRDDTTDGFEDTNYLDLEAVLLVTSLTGSIGFRDVYARPGTDLLYAAGRLPDALVVLDLSVVVDDALKDAYLTTPLATLPVRGSVGEDEGSESLAEIGIAGLAGSADGRYLYATHFNENGLYVFDLDVGIWGSEIAFVPYLGENPYTIRIDPTGRWAAIANYTGEVDGTTAHASIAIVDVDPTSPTWRSVLTRLVNR